MVRLLRVLVLVLVVERRYGREHGKKIAEWVRQSHTGREDKEEEGVGLSEKIEKGLKELRSYYKNDEEVLKKALVGMSGGIGRVMERMAEKIETGKEIKICCVGSSVTAGHDGFGSTAWPAVLERRLRKSGLKNVKVYNQAVGGRNPYPASLCLKSICGHEVDAIFREWQYWSLEDGLSQYGKDALATPEGAATHFVERANELADTSRGSLIGFIFLDTEKSCSSTAKMIAQEYITRKASFGDRAVTVFSSFSEAFNHLRSLAPEKRRARDGKKQCSGSNIGECPLLPYPDGYHTEPEFDVPWKHASHPHRLFINWHPGSLGHEVIGNQIAYFILNQLLLVLQTGPTSNTKQNRANPAVRTMENNKILMSNNVMCAISTLPKADTGLSVGDLVDNTTVQTLWSEQPTPFSKRRTQHCDKNVCNEYNDLKCYNQQRSCSYRDSKRGFSGTSSSGPLHLKIPFKSNHKCIALISEPGYEWSKPVLMANFHHEFSISINGQPCHSDNLCSISVLQERGGYIQTLRIDLSKLFSPCRPATISLTLTPVPSLFAFHNYTISALKKAPPPPICALAKNGRCEPAETWKRYEISCHQHKNKEKFNQACSVQQGSHKNRRPPELVTTFIESVIFY